MDVSVSLSPTPHGFRYGVLTVRAGGVPPGTRLTLRIFRADLPGRGIEREIGLDAGGAGRYEGWFALETSLLRLSAEGAGVRLREVETSFREVPTAELILRAIFLAPRPLARVTAYFLGGDRKGALERFGAIFPRLAAPSYARYRADRLAEAERERPALLEALARRPERPRVTVWVEGGSGRRREGTLRSLRAQIYPAVEIKQVPVRGEATPSAFDSGALTMVLRPGEELRPDAIARMVEPFMTGPATRIVYCDEERSGWPRRRALFKPAWNPRLFLAGRLPLTAALFRSGPPISPPDISLRADISLEALERRLVECALRAPHEAVMHIPRVLVSRPTPGRPPAADLDMIADVASVVWPGTRMAPGEDGHPRLVRPLASPPPVTVIIPTRDRLDLLQSCLSGVLERTSYSRLDVIIADNDSREAETLAFLDEIGRDRRVRRMRHAGPFNYAAMMNRASALSSAPLLLHLNNDIDIVHRDWLAAMVDELADPSVGIVGARLIYPNRTIQHAGITIGTGAMSRHALSSWGLAEEMDNWLHCARDVGAVTGACLLVRRELYESLGGMDEAAFPVAFNDVDLCLRARQAGSRIVFTPHATLIHHESLSRGPDSHPRRRPAYLAEYAAFHDRWNAVFAQDPCYNPNLSLDAEGLTLAPTPRGVEARMAGLGGPDGAIGGLGC